MARPTHLPARRSSGVLAAIKGDPTSAEAAAIQRAAFLDRMQRSTERDLGLLEISDVEALMVRGIAAAGNTASCAAAEVATNPLAASGVSRILATGNMGLDRVLRGYIDGA
jgi:hypothetical protein